MCKIATSRKSCADWPMVSISFYFLSSSSSVYNSRLDRTFRPCACCLCSLTFYFLTDYKQVCCRTYVRLNIYNAISLFLVQLAASDQNQVVLDNLNIKSEVSFILLKPINNSWLRGYNYLLYFQGRYKCEVSAEAPNFQTVHGTTEMSIVG